MPEKQIVLAWERFNVYPREGEIEVLDCFAQPQQRMIMPVEFVRWLAGLLPTLAALREQGLLAEDSK